jgi:hypothetical protein
MTESEKAKIEPEPTLLELLEDPAEKAKWEAMLTTLRKPKGQKAMISASEKTEVKLLEQKLQQGPVISGAFLCVESKKNQALLTAQSLEKTGQVFVHHQDTVIDKKGEEKVRMMPTGQYNWKGQVMRAPGEYWTNAHGVVLPVEVVQACVLRGERVPDHIDLKLQAPEKAWVSGYYPGDKEEAGERKFIFEAPLSQHALNFFSQISRCKLPKADRCKIRRKAAEFDQKIVEQAWERVQQILSRRKDAPETEIPLPEGLGYAPMLPSPTEGMDILERFRRGGIVRRAQEAKAARIQPQVEKHEAEIESLKKELEPIVAQIKQLRANKTGLVFKHGETHFREVILKPLEEKARDLRIGLRWAREAIEELRAEWKKR